MYLQRLQGRSVESNKSFILESFVSGVILIDSFSLMPQRAKGSEYEYLRCQIFLFIFFYLIETFLINLAVQMNLPFNVKTFASLGFILSILTSTVLLTKGYKAVWKK
jgi:hypothetical protein